MDHSDVFFLAKRYLNLVLQKPQFRKKSYADLVAAKQIQYKHMTERLCTAAVNANCNHNLWDVVNTLVLGHY
jgi:hypothetical protein